MPYNGAMEHQLTVRLPADLDDALRSAVARTHLKASDIVRLALREYLHVAVPQQRHAERVHHLLGSLESNISDLASSSREHLLESIRRGG